jgi:hypothetical protein
MEAYPSASLVTDTVNVESWVETIARLMLGPGPYVVLSNSANSVHETTIKAINDNRLKRLIYLFAIFIVVYYLH